LLLFCLAARRSRSRRATPARPWSTRTMSTSSSSDRTTIGGRGTVGGSGAAGRVRCPRLPPTSVARPAHHQSDVILFAGPRSLLAFLRRNRRRVGSHTSRRDRAADAVCAAATSYERGRLGMWRRDLRPNQRSHRPATTTAASSAALMKAVGRTRAPVTRQSSRTQSGCLIRHYLGPDPATDISGRCATRQVMNGSTP